jgi:lipopolysaccharide/colanic/teichoic acid biosynthesis glycosyltransferase
MYTNSDKRLKELAHLNQYHKNALSSDLAHVGIHKLSLETNKGNTVLVNESRVSETENSHSINKQNFDPRLTRVGRIIQKLSIDDLPQLINVIKGDMSIVGNRPLLISEAELLSTDDWTDRFNGPAGVTGLWLLEARGKSGKLSPEERKSLDNKYSEISKSHFSFWKDIWIILRTFLAVFQKKNTYSG